MKKFFLCSLLLFSLGVCAKPYDHSLGVSAGGFNGVSYKALLTEHFALQMDLGVRISEYRGSYGTFELNPMGMFQSSITSTSVCDIDYFAGVGFSLGCIGGFSYYSAVSGKFGVNAITGIEFAFTQAPLAVSFDFRPGYGMSFITYDGYTLRGNLFDWCIALGMRFYL